VRAVLAHRWAQLSGGAALYLYTPYTHHHYPPGLQIPLLVAPALPLSL